jgi:hypothetical protein
MVLVVLLCNGNVNCCVYGFQAHSGSSPSHSCNPHFIRQGWLPFGAFKASLTLRVLLPDQQSEQT